MRKRLILITTSFPFGLTESSFLKQEVKELSNIFDLTIVSRDSRQEQYEQIPAGTEIFRYNAAKAYNALFLLIRALFCIDYWKELFILTSNSRINGKSIKTALAVQMRAIHFADYLLLIRNKHYNNVDVIIYSYWNEYSCYAASKNKRNNDKLITRAHGGDLYELSINNMYQPYKKIFNRKVDHFYFISKMGMEYFSKTYFDVLDKSSVAYLGVHEQPHLNEFTGRDDVRIISFSYVRDIKRIDRIIESLALISEKKIVWKHIGARYLYDEIREYAHKLLDKKTNIDYEFLGEMKNEDAIKYILNNEFDFLLNVSSTEGLPMTMMEAMSMSIPVVGTDVGGVSEIIDDNINGYLINSNFENENLCSIFESYSAMKHDAKMEMRNNAFLTWQNKFNDVANYSDFANSINTL